MADGAASPSRLRRETEVRSHLPYARHVNDHIVALDSGALMMVFQVAGASFETADVRDLNDWHVKLNQAWRNLADEDWDDFLDELVAAITTTSATIEPISTSIFMKKVKASCT